MATYGKYYAVRDAGTPSRLSRAHQTYPHRLKGLEDAPETPVSAATTRDRSWSSCWTTGIAGSSAGTSTAAKCLSPAPLQGRKPSATGFLCRPVPPALPVDESASACHPVRAIPDGLVARGRLVAVFAHPAHSRAGRGSVNLYGCCEWGQHPECRALGPLSTQSRWSS
jgi:hypothetical protein